MLYSTTNAQAKSDGELLGGVLNSVHGLLSDYYRRSFSELQFLVPSQPAHPSGYFLYGPDTMCYGELSCGAASKSPIGNLPDARPHIALDGQKILLPFDAGQVVENLRRERYAAQFRKTGEMFNDILRRAYYLIRPMLGVSVRRHLQKLRLHGWDDIVFPAWPVDSSVERIHRKLMSLVLRAQGVDRLPFIWFWPDGFSCCSIVTHDVEDLPGRDYCARLMDLDESFGIRSSFQVVPESRYAVTKDFLESITSRGFEVNVHDLKHDGRLFAERAEFLRRAKRINQHAREFGAEGFRSGVLYRNADWYDAFEFSYDMSIPNVGHLDPQGGGCCTVMPYFIGKIVELPVTCTQDYTLFHILRDYSIDLWIRQIATVREEHGLVSFIIHPDYVIEPRARETYKTLLRFLGESRAAGTMWSPLPRDVARWWRQRRQMELVQENGEWRVTGPDSERARVAYACLSGDSVTYRLAC